MTSSPSSDDHARDGRSREGRARGHDQAPGDLPRDGEPQDDERVTEDLARDDQRSEPRAVIPGDQARASVTVRVPVEDAFRIFTEEIDQWWRRGLRYRVSGKHRGMLYLEPQVGGNLYETFETKSGPRIVRTGTVLRWEPPHRIVFEWRAVNFAPDEKTEVDVQFEPIGEKTLVTVTHRGWSKIRPDHPARHRQSVQPFLRMMGMWWGDLLTSLRLHAEP
ncbi:MAG: SRPBCC domain-containing protein [Candidatus Eisenbacteria bacterium]|uniref:SRPBCC domain-containing protein n=1 Tax=Eiseniibacteriota bacterium TaxID=2212470 RepID=A0A956RPR4_UNCEI|nr:SRPBCC domain-containing protein [Candidatus Eisenbacteria bacterium]